MDINSSSYDPDAKVNDGICAYRYLKTVTVDENLGYTDEILRIYEKEDQTSADIQFKMVRKYKDPVEDYYDVKTSVVYDVKRLPLTWDINITDDYLQTEMEYEYRLVDVNRTGETNILSGSFMPDTAYRDNRIILGADGFISVVLTYIEF